MATFIDLMIWIIAGGIIGWIASLLMGVSGRQGILLNVVVGILGAFVANLFLTPFFRIPTINEGNFSLQGVLVSLLGAIILLAVVNLFRRFAIR